MLNPGNYFSPHNGLRSSRGGLGTARGRSPLPSPPTRDPEAPSPSSLSCPKDCVTESQLFREPCHCPRPPTENQSKEQTLGFLPLARLCVYGGHKILLLTGTGVASGPGLSDAEKQDTKPLLARKPNRTFPDLGGVSQGPKKADRGLVCSWGQTDKELLTH